MYAVELRPKKLFYDFFCSQQCCLAVHPNLICESGWPSTYHFFNKKEFKELTNTNVGEANCFNCGNYVI